MSNDWPPSLNAITASQVESSIGQGNSTSQGFATLEAVQVLQERFFAYETQVHAQLLAQQKTLQLQEFRLQDLETKLAGNSNGRSNGPAAITGFGEGGVLSADGILEVRERQEHHDATLEQLKREAAELNKMAENVPVVLGRAAAVETRQKALEDDHADQARRLEALILEQSMNSLQAMTAAESMEYMKNLHLEPEHELASSVWDLLFFLGTKELRSGGSFFGMLMLAFNVFLQIGFVVVCNLNFTQADITGDDVEAAKQFRYTFSHDQRFMDYHTKSSLATRLCDPDMYPSLELEMATFQRSVLSEIERFLREDESWAVYLLNGQFMCLIAMGCWTLTVNMEFRAISNFCSAIFQLPRHPGENRTKIKVERNRNGDEYKLEFENVTSVRVAALVASAIMRTIIALNLLVCGCIWLATTSEVEELLVNAIALEFIMQLDELVFESLAPGHARAILRNFKPLKREKWKHYHGLEIRSLGGALMVPLVMISCYWWQTAPMVENMKDVVHELCHEPRGFIYGSDALGFVHLGSTDTDNSFGGITTKAVQEALQTQSSEAFSGLLYSFDPRDSGTSLSIQEIISTSSEDLVNAYNPYCTDLLNQSSPQGYSRTLALYAQEVYGHLSCGEQATKAYCADIGSSQGLFVRALCPQTCGCDDPFSPLPVDRGIYGCPFSCWSSQNYKRVQEGAACYNPNVVDLTSTNHWKALVAFARVYETTYKGVGDALERYGCDFASNFSDGEAVKITQHLCQGTLDSGLKSIAIACPATCQCDNEEFALSWCLQGPSSQFCRCKDTLDGMMRDPPARPQGDCEDLICQPGKLHTVWNQADGLVEPFYETLLADAQRLQSLCLPPTPPPT